MELQRPVGGTAILQPGPPPPGVAASNHCANSSPPYAATQILASLKSTNAVAEGINRIVKIVKNRASGFRHLQPFG